MDNNGEGAEAGFVSVVFAVFACAVRLVDDPRLKEGESNDGMGIIFYERCVLFFLFFPIPYLHAHLTQPDRAMILHYIGHSYTQLAHVQCFVLLASFLASLNCLPQAWLLVGQAVRTAQDLGLHVSGAFLTENKIGKLIMRVIAFSTSPDPHCH